MKKSKIAAVTLGLVLAGMTVSAMANDDDGLPSMPVTNSTGDGVPVHQAKAFTNAAAANALKNSYFKSNPNTQDLTHVYGPLGQDPTTNVQECLDFDAIHKRCRRFSPTQYQMQQTIKAGIDIGMKGLQLQNDINSQIHGINGR